MNIQQIKKDGYSFFNRQAPENRLKNITTVQYIEDIASKSGVNISLWNLKEMFEDQEKRTKESFHLLTDKKLINKIFFEKREELLGDSSKEVEMINKSIEAQVIAITAAQTKTRIDRLKQEMSSQERNVVAHFNNANQYLERVCRSRIEIEEAEGRKSSVPDEISKVLKSGFWKFYSLESENIIFTTAEDIVLNQVNRSAGVDLRVNMGQYMCKLNLKTMRVLIEMHEKNVMVGDIYHPYISSNGDPCWGTASDRAANHLSKARIADLMELLATLLSTYTDSNPYRRLSDFAMKRPEDAKPKILEQQNVAKQKLVVNIPDDDEELEDIF